MSADNIAIVRRFTDEGCIGGNREVVDEVVAPECVDHDPMPGAPGTRDGMRRTVDMVINGLSDRRMEVDEYLDAGDTVVQNWIHRGVHTGPFLGMAPTGKEVAVRGIEIWRVSNGRIVEHWGVVDVAGVLAQLGANAATQHEATLSAS